MEKAASDLWGCSGEDVAGFVYLRSPRSRRGSRNGEKQTVAQGRAVPSTRPSCRGVMGCLWGK